MKALDGNKTTDIGTIPEEWQVMPLGSVATIVSGGTPNTETAEYWENGVIPWATPTDITSNGKYIDTTARFITRKGLESSAAVLLPTGSILMTSRATIGACSINKVPMSTNQGFKSLIAGEKLYNEFLYYLMNSKTKALMKLAGGSTFLEVSKVAVEGLLCQIPPLPEQQKIADILSTVDEHISETGELIEKTKTLKQGMMQRLLTKGIGHTEFKETEIGRIPVEWEVVLIGSKGTTYGGLAGKDKYDFGSGSPFITYRSIFDSSIVDLSRVEYVYVAETEKQNAVALGDLFFTTSSETPEEVGMCSALLDPPVGKMYLNSFCFGYRISDQSSFVPDFARFLFRGECFRSAVTKIGQGSTRYNLSKNAMMKIKIPMPPNCEQRQIASILSSIDGLIDTYQAKLDALTRLKSGLMQQLLAGRIRVKV
jgi:type I restriction enzyme S subunit